MAESEDNAPSPDAAGTELGAELGSAVAAAAEERCAFSSVRTCAASVPARYLVPLWVTAKPGVFCGAEPAVPLSALYPGAPGAGALDAVPAALCAELVDEDPLWEST